MSHRTRTITTGLLAAALAAAFAAPAGAAPGGRAAVSPENSGFASGLDGWTVTGDTAAATAEAGGRTGDRLTHWSDAPYEVTTSQRLGRLGTGWWTASAWVKSGGLDTSTLSLTCTGGTSGTVTLPQTLQDDAWVRVAVSAKSRGGDCGLAVATSDDAGGAWASVDDIAVERGRVTRDVRGGDLSGLAKNEDHGATYADVDGTPGDAVQILADHGMNLGRLKVWVDPADGYNEVTHVVESARRIQAAGMDVMVDFHYSDRWTDPGAQGVPAEWAGSGVAAMTDLLAAHTREVMTALVDAGVDVAYAQVGNEINPGMLWPYGQTWDAVPGDGVDGAQWDALAGFLTAGHDAVKAVSPTTQTILHLTNINNGIDGLTWWFDEVTARDVPFDLVGLSYYGYWHGSLTDLQEAVSTLSARYDRDVVVVETAYPFTLEDDAPAWENVVADESQLVAGYPATPEGQAAAFRAVQDVVAAAPGGRGLGAVYWEPAWTSVAGNGWDPADPASGNAWENQAMFDHDGRLLGPVAATLAAG
ncbi:glycoside hydrolase family 53 protein [Krasilnikoviella flava]|uniref:Arabinogalactan endo-beta-1,4-galactanase n=1 Tax=Krasilnikoviella flava TaxID=526729 RepID=A0A1T5M044_9MICO|nr:glycosyl hydrolase 53 family protein [Krasilnikoviella flava]SKC81188.1 arabinogalactan endo-1,4-beta-galactosidase [Krasilnikoviella flava]